LEEEGNGVYRTGEWVGWGWNIADAGVLTEVFLTWESWYCMSAPRIWIMTVIMYANDDE
jgi:hypothetical protein